MIRFRKLVLRYGVAAGFTAAAMLASLLVKPAAGSLDLAGRLMVFALIALLLPKLIARAPHTTNLLAATLSGMSDAVITTDQRGIITFLNPVAEELTGWTRAEAQGKHSRQILQFASEKTGEKVEDPVEKALRQESAVALRATALLIARDGARIPIEDSAAPIRDQKGRVCAVLLVFRDVSRRRQALDQASHSQKMEAVGRLASGVAGDFNNLLTIVTGYGELLRLGLASGHPMRRFAEEILSAAERAAGLTRQLLAFGRGQAAQARVLDLNAVIANMDTMLRRLLGENMELVLLPGPGLGRVKCDPGQIEQILVNLAMNSRDAMRNGGRFVVETTNVELDDPDASKRLGLEPGSYVMLAASDNGCGMDVETRSRLFEPFFTTKEQGKGSGLGLSIVYGIVKQNRGQITVYSEIDCGTIFEIYLPRVEEAVEVIPPGKPGRAGKGSEIILLVDDQEGVRNLVSAVLQSNGYTVIEAEDGTEGLAAYQKNADKIDLLLTDIVMPRLNGFELSQRLIEKNSRLPVLYMSGYRDHPFGAGDRGATLFLHKPFTPDVLLAKVREALDAGGEGARG